MQNDASRPRTLVVFGASGAIGSRVVDAAAAAGWTVRAFTRDAAKVGVRPGVTAVVGDATEPEAVAAAIEGVDAVVNALGPTSNRREEVASTLAATRNILAGMRRHDVRRLVSLSGAAVTVRGERKPIGARIASAIVRLAVGNVVRAKQAEYEELAGSDVDWTIVRPPRVVDAPPVGRTVTGDRLHSRTVTESDLASFMVEELERREFVRQAPYVSG